MRVTTTRVRSREDLVRAGWIAFVVDASAPEFPLASPLSFAGRPRPHHGPALYRSLSLRRPPSRLAQVAFGVPGRDHALSVSSYSPSSHPPKGPESVPAERGWFASRIPPDAPGGQGPSATRSAHRLGRGGDITLDRMIALPPGQLPSWIEWLPSSPLGEGECHDRYTSPNRG
jgi:hypothetical protein